MKAVQEHAVKRTMHGVMLVCCLCCGGFTPAQAQDAGTPAYAVVSLIGDSLSVSPYMDTSSVSRVVTRGLGGWENHSAVTGSRLNPPQDLATPVKETTLDDAAVAAIAGAIRQREPAAGVELLSGRNTGWYSAQGRMFDASNAAKDSRESLKAILKERKVAYLIVVTKRRSRTEMLADPHLFADAQLRLMAGSSGDTKWLEGIGFYVDDVVRVQNLKTFEFSTGVLVSFVNATVRLVDAKTLEVVRERTVMRSKIIAISRPLEAGFSAWDEATAAQKLESLQDLIRTSMAETIPDLLIKAP
jgi:hypothetical protein